MNYDDLISRFKIFRKNGDSAQCFCPAHHDTHPSLTISKGRNDNIVIFCHAGCRPNDILSAAGLSFKDLYNDVHPHSKKGVSDFPSWKSFLEMGGKRKIKNIYHYYDYTDDSYCYTKIRFEGKEMVIGRFEGAVEHSRIQLKNASGKPYKELYPNAIYGNLTKIKNAIKNEETIFITEGEKDVDTLSELGYTALTYGSANDWKPTLANLLNGANVFVLTDNDDAGKRVAQKIEKDCDGIARTCNILIPTPKIEHGDISDYFENGHTASDFDNLIAKTEIALRYLPTESAEIVKNTLKLCDLDLKYNRKGELVDQTAKQNIRNIEIVLEHDPRFKGRIRYDLFSQRLVAFLPLPWNQEPMRSWTDSDDSNLFSILQAEYGFKRKSDYLEAISIVARNHQFHPVIEALESLVYRGDGYIKKLLPSYLGCEDTAYTAAIMKLFMLGAISRVYHPGCKFDYCLMLQGPQGIGKSTFLQELALDDAWFNDSLDSLDSKDAVQSLLGSWIIELGELKSFNNTKGGVDSVKRFLTARQDKVRLAYDKWETTFQRQCVFAGTTNKSGYLMDDTGNRRFLIMRCGVQDVTANLFCEDAFEDFKAAWAEALNIFKCGDYSLVLSKDLAQEASSLLRRAEIDDYRIDIITEYLGDSDLAYIPDIWSNALHEDRNIEKWQAGQIAQILVNLGFEKNPDPKKFKGKAHRNVYEKKNNIQ